MDDEEIDKTHDYVGRVQLAIDPGLQDHAAAERSRAVFHGGLESEAADSQDGEPGRDLVGHGCSWLSFRENIARGYVRLDVENTASGWASM